MDTQRINRSSEVDNRNNEAPMKGTQDGSSRHQSQTFDVFQALLKRFWDKKYAVPRSSDRMQYGPRILCVRGAIMTYFTLSFEHAVKTFQM